MEDPLCYFCDIPYPHPSCFMYEYNGIYMCFNCNEFGVPINIATQQDGECCVCLECTILIKLPNCAHMVCLKCCKTIYFGTATIERPTHFRELLKNSPDWPYEFDDDNENDPVRIKYDEYCEFDGLHFDDTLSYDELITIRDSLIPHRPEWMNSEEFINYENKNLLYHTSATESDKLWEQYENTKLRGSKTCPLCRAI